MSNVQLPGFESDVVVEEVKDPNTGQVSNRQKIVPRNTQAHSKLVASFKKLWTVPVDVFSQEHEKV